MYGESPEGDTRFVHNLDEEEVFLKGVAGADGPDRYFLNLGSPSKDPTY
jgi:hypothetical protein